jgi:hypothetical protein
MRAIRRGLRGLARMLLIRLQKKRQLKKDDARGRSDASQYSTHHLEPQAISPEWHCSRFRMSAEAMNVDAGLRLGLQWRR